MNIIYPLLDYLGDINQVCGMKRYALLDGKAKNTEAIDIDNGSGLFFTVLTDRCMDIATLKFKGTPLAFLSRTGIVSPAFYNDRGDEWLRSFGGGLLTTCGFTQAGEPCEFDGVYHGLHGPASSLPARLTMCDEYWQNDVYTMELRGRIRQAKPQYEHIELERRIICTAGQNTVCLADTIRNEGARPEPLMLVYHMNFGFPLVNPSCGIFIPSAKVSGWDDYSTAHAAEWRSMPAPHSDAKDRVFLHTPRSEDGRTGFLLCNDRETPTMAVHVSYTADVLHTLAQWQYPCKRDYVMALEPCNHALLGVKHEHESKTLRYINPGESVSIRLEISVLDDPPQIKKLQAEIYDFSI
ncbi:aldose 1-epimerase family protein [Christensenellaceae bacterium OttesenSCG-928-K19]|nr:aldose 1-epimerase family protein [Christensenellaceae bacterium OttesenSCG-928-K19]